ncbi:phage major capsid protein [Sporosarcina obsidiansis]|uniref:phage major capsid protein n=1 Tax=Sporosarcina obsidiansis TaxID=2660748 RepID=UPI00129A98B2|nr:phage major capsid protein [Sporosarcina obsidiansis]
MGKLNKGERYTEAFWDSIRTEGGISLKAHLRDHVTNEEVRSIASNVSVGGGRLAPVSIEENILKRMKESNPIRQMATQLSLSAGNAVVPYIADNEAATFIKDNDPIPEGEFQLDAILLKGYRIARIVKLPEELEQDTEVNLQALVESYFAESFSMAEENAFINGLGDEAGMPTGILTRAEVGVTGKHADNITSEELTKLFYSLKPKYRQRAVWIMNDQTLLAVRSLKTTDGMPIYQPSLGNDAERLLGRPVLVSEYMPNLSNGNKAIAFGDLSYYVIGDREGMVMQRLGEKYAVEGLVGVRGIKRVDANLAKPEAVKVFENRTGV